MPQNMFAETNKAATTTSPTNAIEHDLECERKKLVSKKHSNENFIMAQLTIKL